MKKAKTSAKPFRFNLIRRWRTKLNYTIKYLEQIYKTAGISTPFESYVMIMKIAPIAIFIVSYAIIVPLQLYMLKINIIISLLLAILPALALSLTTLYFLIYYPQVVAKSRASSIDASLVYTVSFMAAASAAGLDINRILERTVEVEYNKHLKNEILLILRDVKVLGLNTTAALKRAVERSPSRIWREILESVRETSLTSGDLRSILYFMVLRLIEDKRRLLQEVVNSLDFISEIYITLMVAGPIMFIILLTMMSLLGGSVGGVDPLVLIFFMSFVMIPLASLAILIMIDTIFSKV